MGFDDLEDEASDQTQNHGGFDDLDAAMGSDSSETLDDRDGEHQAADSTDSDAGEETNSMTTPAFEYEEAKNAAQYVRKETANTLDEAWEYDGKPYLGREIGLENIAKREWQDAVFRYAAQNPEAVADLVVEAREEAHGPIDENGE